MPKKITERELAAIVAVVRSLPEGASVGELMEGDALDYARRTLQRRLDVLTGSGRLVAQGNGRSRRYLAAEKPYGIEGLGFHPVSRPPAVLRESRGEGSFSKETASARDDGLSAEALELKAHINLPRAQRIPVGYNADFLTAYVPNKTYYLPAGTRRELAQLGQIGILDLPAGTYLRQILDRLLIDLAWNSSRLEGNTYSRLETERLLARGENAAGKDTEETQMILNHKAAIEMLAEQAEEIGFNRYTTCSLHALLSDNLLRDSTACGRLRDQPVGITGTVFHPLEVPQMLEEYFMLIMAKAAAIRDPYEAGFFVMVHLPYLQPFEDVNKRVSRLAANIPLIQNNLCPLSFVDVESADYLGGLLAVYELNRIEYLRDVYVWAYKRSCQRYKAVRQSLGEPDPFRLKYRTLIGETVRGIVKGGQTKKQADATIREAADELPDKDDKSQLIQVLNLELHSLHEGNIARYRLRPKEFTAWQGGLV